MDIKEIVEVLKASNPQIDEILKNAYEAQVKAGDTSVSRFRLGLNEIIQSFAPTSGGRKGLQPSGCFDKSEINSHFSRGRKWVEIPIDSQLGERLCGVAVEKDFIELLSLWRSHEKAWVRYHSCNAGGINFAIHPNSSNSVGIAKVSVGIEEGLGLEIMAGTPKSCGYEEIIRVKKEEEEVVEEEVNEVEEVEDWDEVIEDLEIEEGEDI